MISRLPIFDGYHQPHTTVELAAPIDRDVFPVEGLGDRGRSCDRCALGAQKESSLRRTPCMAADGEPGGLLVVGEYPNREFDDTVGRPFQGVSGQEVRRLVKEHWKGPVAYDNAIRCAPGRSTNVTDKMVAACRGLLAQTLQEVKPKRVLALGSIPAVALLGRNVPTWSSRGAYAWLSNAVPIFFAGVPAHAIRNRFLRGWFEEDVKHALTCPDPPPAPWHAEATIVSNEKLALYAERELLKGGWFAFDVETQGTMWNEDFRIISTALCGDRDDDVWVWPELPVLPPEVDSVLRLGGRFSDELFERVARVAGVHVAVLFRLLTDKRLAKVGSNVKYDQLAFRARYGITVSPITVDTRLQRKLLEPEAQASLGAMSELVGMGGHKEEAQDRMDAALAAVGRAMRKKTVEAQNDAFAKLGLPPEIEAAIRLGDDPRRYMFALLPKEVLYRYNARDAVATKKLASFMHEKIEEEPALKRVWEEQVCPAAIALERVEAWGVAASKDAISAFDQFLAMREQKAKAQLDYYGEVNWGSPMQVADLLFNRLKLPPQKETKGGAQSTDGEVLDALAKKTGHPLPAALLDYRFVTKLRGTYAQGMFPHVRSDGRIHPNIKLDGARSGRTSCVDPNLQNIPRAQTPEGKMARDCFVAPPGFVLLEADYSQLELRVAAMLSGDKVMQEIFASGVDYHLRTAQLVSKIAWGISPEQVEDKHRSFAKTVNFGVIYGKTASTFAEEWGVSRAKAQTVVDAIMGNFVGLQKWCAEREAEVLRTGEIWTWWKGKKARRRSMWQIASPDSGQASVAKNGARNTPIQGTASDFCVASLAQAVQWIEEDGIEDRVKLVLAVHDSLMFEVREDMVREVALTVNDIMTSHESNGVPLVADFKLGKSWGSLKKYDLKAA